MEPSPRSEPPSNLPAVPPERRPVPQQPWATGQHRPAGPHGDGTNGPAGPHGAAGPYGDAGPGRAAGQQPAGVPPGPAPAGPSGPGGGPPRPDWRHRLRPRSLRLAVGLGLVAAALLLFPFLDEPDRWWIPAGLGFGTLALLFLFRLDRLLFGWAPHVAGVVLVGALVWSTRENPWSWALAASVGVVLAGLLLLPRWRVLAVGVALLAVSAVGYQFRSTEIAGQQAQVDAQAGNQARMVIGVDRPQQVLFDLDVGVQDNDWERVCRMLQDGAHSQLLQTTGAPDCVQAVSALHARVSAEQEKVIEPKSTGQQLVPGQSVIMNGCTRVWGKATGPALGQAVVIRTDAATPRFQVVAFQPC